MNIWKKKKNNLIVGVQNRKTCVRSFVKNHVFFYKTLLLFLILRLLLIIDIVIDSSLMPEASCVFGFRFEKKLKVIL